MTAPDFKTQVTEVVSYGETAGFILLDITGLYNVTTNPGGWGDIGGSDPNLEPGDIVYAMVFITPYEGDEIPILLEMSDTQDDLYWRKLLDHLGETGISIDLSVLGIDSYPDGYWKFKSFYWPGYKDMTHAGDATGFTVGEIVQGQTSGATGYFVAAPDGTSVHVVSISGDFTDPSETIVGLTSGTSLTYTAIADGGTEWENTEVYSYTNHQSILTATRNTVRKQPLDIILPRINEKHSHYVGMADLLLETLDDAVEVGQIENYTEIFDFTKELIERIDETYCID